MYIDYNWITGKCYSNGQYYILDAAGNTVRCRSDRPKQAKLVNEKKDNLENKYTQFCIKHKDKQ